jgi:Putative Ig domain
MRNLTWTAALRLRHLAFVAGFGMLAGSVGFVALTASSAPLALADTAPYTAACTSTFSGTFTASGIVTTGSLSDNPVLPGGSETLNDYGMDFQLPASFVNVLLGDSVTSLTGTITTAIDATNITPASTQETLTASTGPLVSNVPLAVATTPLATPPSFTDAAATGVVHITQDASITFSFQAQVSGIGIPIGITVTCTAEPADIDTATIGVAPQITSVAGDMVPAGSPFSYTVTATGTPAPTLSVASPSTLPAGVTLTDNGDGTATLAGTSSVSPGVYTFTLQADNGVGPTATQAFTLTVAAPGAPAITSSPTTTVTAGTAMAPFAITTDGFPVPALTRKGPLPAGVTFTDNHNGTATISGNPKANQGGTYVLTLAASNDEGTATQTFTLVVNQTPTVTSHATTTFTAGVAGTFTVTTDGNPAPALIYTGAQPPGITFTDNGDGTATISGIPAADGSYPILVTATNAAGSVSQSLTINVDQSAAITSAPGATATAGTAMAPFTITTTGFPVPSLSKNGPLPSGITFTDNHDGTATISGVPKASQGGPYVITLTASNNQGSATQTFTLTVNEAPVLTSHSSTTFTAGDYGTFTVTTHGFPAPALTYTGVLPAGLTFVDNGDGTATISGIPTADGSYPILITATNGFGTVSDSFTVKVS